MQALENHAASAAAPAAALNDRAAELAPVRSAISSAMSQYFERHAERIAAVDAAREANQRARAAGLSRAAHMPPPLPPVGIMATVGLGKSRGVDEIAKAAWQKGLPIVILVPSHDLAHEYADRLRSIGAVVYQGRRDPAPEGDPGPHACYKIIPVAIAGSKNQRPAQGLCVQCPHGAAGVLHFVKRDQVRIERANNFFKTRGIDPKAVAPCQFLFRGLPDQLAAPILIAPVQAFCEAIASFREIDPVSGFLVRETQRLIIIDEHIQPAEEIEINAGEVKVWRNRLVGLREKLENQIAKLQAKPALAEFEQKELEQNRELLALIPEIDDVFRAVAGKIASDTPIGQDALRIVELQKQVTRAGGSIAGTAAWEKVSYDADKEEFFIPLRALATLARNIENGSVRQEASALFAYEVSPIIEWARDRGSVMFLDATMGRTMRQFIESRGGRVYEFAASQNMVVTRFTGRLYARGEVKKEGYKDKAKARIAEIRDVIVPGLPKPAAIITHKAFLKYSQDAHLAYDAAQAAAQEFEAATSVPIGWFGRHDRGLNAWSGRHLALVGMPILSKESIAGAYACTRAAMIACGIEMPAWDGRMDKERADAEGPPMPVMPEVRAWLVDHYAQGVAQAVGRNRAVNHPSYAEPLQVHLFGGLQSEEMDEALARYGVIISERKQNPRSTPGPKPDGDAINEAIEMVRAVGSNVSLRSVRDALVGLKRRASDVAIRERLKDMRERGELAPAVRVRKAAALSRADEGQEQSPPAATAAATTETAAVAATEANSYKVHIEGNSPQFLAAAAPAAPAKAVAHAETVAPDVAPVDCREGEGQRKDQPVVAAPTASTAANSYIYTVKGISPQCAAPAEAAAAAAPVDISFAPTSREAFRFAVMSNVVDQHEMVNGVDRPEVYSSDGDECDCDLPQWGKTDNSDSDGDDWSEEEIEYLFQIAREAEAEAAAALESGEPEFERLAVLPTAASPHISSRHAQHAFGG